MNNTISLFLMGAAGVLLDSLRKMKSIHDAAISANMKFHWYRTYVRKDAIAIISAFLSVFIWYGVFGEWGKKYPYINDIKMTLFVLAGFAGSTILHFAFDGLAGSAKRSISKIVDVKTNISDITTKTGKDATIEEVIEKGNEATGVDVTVAPPAPKDVKEADTITKP